MNYLSHCPFCGAQTAHNLPLQRVYRCGTHILKGAKNYIRRCG